MPGRRKNDTVEVVVLSESDQDMEQPSDRNRPTPTTSQPVVEDVMDLTCDTDEEEKVVPGRIRIKGKYNWNKGVETVTYQEFKNKKPEEWLHLYPRGILVECLDHVPDCLADHVKVIQVPSTLRLNAKDWEEVTGAFKTGCKQFRTIHPKEEKTPLPMQLQSMQRQFDDTAAAAAQQPTDASHVIGRLQGAACQMAMHTDCPSRNYSVNLVWRQCTDGTGGSVDFLNSKQPTIVYRIIFSVPSVYLMSAYGGGITRDHEGSQWAHGVDTATLGQGHHLCALVVEYPTPVQFSSMTELLAARWAGIGMSMDMSTCSLTSQQLQALNVPTEWPASPKTVISQLIGSFGGKASAASSRGQAQVANRASKKQKKDRSPIEQKAVDDRQAAGEARQAQIANIAGKRGNYGVSVDILAKMTSEEQENHLKKQMASNGENSCKVLDIPGSTTKKGRTGEEVRADKRSAGSTNLSPEEAREKKKNRKAGQENLSTNEIKGLGGAATAGISKASGSSAFTSWVGTEFCLWCSEQSGQETPMYHSLCPWKQEHPGQAYPWGMTGQEANKNRVAASRKWKAIRQKLGELV